MDIQKTAVVAILTRAPSGGGKSRLFTSLGRPPDPDLLAALLLDTLDGASAPDLTRVVAVEPPARCDEVRALVGASALVIPQSEGTLGERMRAVFSEMFSRGAGAVILIGSDLPTMTTRPLDEALDWLARDPASLVLGPSRDGGYYLIAARHTPAVFDQIAWGTTLVLAQTLEAARHAGINVHLLDPLADVDDAGDLFAVLDLSSLAPGVAPRTAAWAKATALPSCRKDGK